MRICACKGSCIDEDADSSSSCPTGGVQTQDFLGKFVSANDYYDNGTSNELFNDQSGTW